MNSSDHSFSVTINRNASHFCASHALVLDEYVEGLHGHNYRVEVEITGNVSAEGILIDFIFLDELIKQLLSEWDHYTLFPLHNPRISVLTSELDHNLQIRYADRIYSIPKAEVKLLPCRNVTTETLSRLLNEKLAETLQSHPSWEQIYSITVTIWETQYYKASYTFTRDDPTLAKTY
ncbi:MAG: 6-pyruvoyl tetrahydropterin synthase family protein [Candidatus Heimdallarchaeota archaeon]